MTAEHLKWIHIVTSNLKRYLISTHQGVFGSYRKEYVAKFLYRFNRSIWPAQAFDRLLFANIFKGPTPLRVGGAYVHNQALFPGYAGLLPLIRTAVRAIFVLRDEAKQALRT